MESFTRTIGWWIINLDMLLLVILAVGLALCLFGRCRWGARLVGFSSVILILFAVVPIGFWSLEWQENVCSKPQQIPADAKGIIVLGGSFDRMNTAGREETSYNLAAGRFIAFAQLMHAHPHLQFVFTGGGRPLKFMDGVEISEAEIAQKELQKLGIDSSKMIFESKSVNTVENAHLSKELVKPAPSDKWVLVTSAYHMPRSVALFEGAGWNVIPYPVDYHTPGKFEPYYFMGLFKNMYMWSHAVGEWLSMTQNYYFGRTKEIFPRSCAAPQKSVI